MKWKEISSSPCNLCPRECKALRGNGQTGYCLLDERIFVARAALHMWEEPCISGLGGSGTVFFSGCNLRCVYCQNYEISKGEHGKEVSIERLSEIFLELQAKGAANINLVTPDHYVIAIAEAIMLAKEKGLTLPIVYNGSGYEKSDVIKKLSGIVDIFLTDFKYMDENLAEKYSAAPDYPSVAKAALSEMVNICGEPEFDDEGMMKKGVIVRHLLLPGHKKNLDEIISIGRYTPFERLKENPEYEELCRKVTKREYEAVIDYALSIGVKNAFIQEGDVAMESFIPSFDGEGV